MRLSWIYLIVIAVWAALYLPGLGSTELKGEEGRRILPAREMMRTGDYALPFSEGKPYHRKPPLVNWSIAGAFRLTGGESEFAARLPSVISLLLLALMGVWAGRALAGRDGALWLPLAMLTMFGVIEKGRLAEIESLFLSLSGIGMLVWLALWRRGSGVWVRWIAAGAVFGLATLAKGPVFLPFFYAVAVVVLWKSGTKRELWHPAHFVGLALTLLPMAVWLHLAGARMDALGDDIPRGAAGQSEVLVNQITKRLNPASIDWAGWFANPWQTLLLLSPWAPLAVFLWRPARKRWWPLMEEKDRALVAGLGYGCLACGLAYALLPEGRARFQMPLVAPVAALAVLLVSGWKQFGQAENEGEAPVGGALLWRVWSGVVRWVCLLVSVVAAVAAPVLMGRGDLSAMEGARALCVLGGGLGVLWLGIARIRAMAAPGRAFAETAAAMVMVMLVNWLIVIPVMARHENVRPAALAILKITGPEPDIAAFYPGPQPFLFYLGPKCVEIASIRQLADSARFVVLPEKRWEGDGMPERLAKKGFTRELLRVKDDDGTPYVLVGRGA